MFTRKEDETFMMMCHDRQKAETRRLPEATNVYSICWSQEINDE